MEVKLSLWEGPFTLEESREGSLMSRALSWVLSQGLRAALKVTFNDFEEKDLVSRGT